MLLLVRYKVHQEDILERSDGSVLVYVANHGSEDNFDGNKSVLKFLLNQEDGELLLLSSFVHDLHIRNDFLFKLIIGRRTTLRYRPGPRISGFDSV